MARWIQYIDDAAPRDWRAADRLLQTAPETRDQFSTRAGTGGQKVQIVLNVGREDGSPPATIIEGVAATSTDG